MLQCGYSFHDFVFYMAICNSNTETESLCSDLYLSFSKHNVIYFLGTQDLFCNIVAVNYVFLDQLITCFTTTLKKYFSWVLQWSHHEQLHKFTELSNIVKDNCYCACMRMHMWLFLYASVCVLLMSNIAKLNSVQISNTTYYDPILKELYGD